ncbi:MAG TPA: hypothetical protein HA301_04690, partial [Methanothermobacter thermautotrophicus]|nr:hypothetical protein [Methanothermobacter thermautotrophicus]
DLRKKGVSVRDLETREVKNILWGEYEDMDVVGRADDVKTTTVTS